MKRLLQEISNQMFKISWNGLLFKERMNVQSVSEKTLQLSKDIIAKQREIERWNSWYVVCWTYSSGICYTLIGRNSFKIWYQRTLHFIKHCLWNIVRKHVSWTDVRYHKNGQMTRDMVILLSNNMTQPKGKFWSHSW